MYCADNISKVYDRYLRIQIFSIVTQTKENRSHESDITGLPCIVDLKKWLTLFNLATNVADVLASSNCCSDKQYEFSRHTLILIQLIFFSKVPL
jgi:hypothetical protein